MLQPRPTCWWLSLAASRGLQCRVVRSTIWSTTVNKLTWRTPWRSSRHEDGCNSNWQLVPVVVRLGDGGKCAEDCDFYERVSGIVCFPEVLGEGSLELPERPLPFRGRGEMAMFAPCCPSLAAKAGHYDVVQLSR